MGAQQGSREIKSLSPLPVQPVEQAELSEKSNKGVMNAWRIDDFWGRAK